MMRDFGFIWQLWSFDDKVMSKWPIYVNIPELKMQTETARCMKPFHRVHSTFHEHTSGYIQLFRCSSKLKVLLFPTSALLFQDGTCAYQLRKLRGHARNSVLPLTTIYTTNDFEDPLLMVQAVGL